MTRKTRADWWFMENLSSVETVSTDTWVNVSASLGRVAFLGAKLKNKDFDPHFPFIFTGIKCNISETNKEDMTRGR
jgi:hypothetical protein